MTAGSAPQLTTAARSRSFKSYLEKRKLPVNADAAELLEALRELYHIDSGCTVAQARDIAGVRYELDSRSSYTFAEDVSSEVISQITDGHFDGVTIKTASARVYNTSWPATSWAPSARSGRRNGAATKRPGMWAMPTGATP